MKKSKLRNLVWAAALTLLMAGSAGAVTISYDFQANITSGDLIGNSYQGHFSFDDGNLTGVGTEYIRPGTDTLTVSFSFEGYMYTEIDDHDYDPPHPTLGQFPRVTFIDGVLEHLNFRFTDPDFGVVHLTFLDESGPVIRAADFVGDVVYTASSVPEPSTMLLLGVGLGGLAVFRRKFRRN